MNKLDKEEIKKLNILNDKLIEIEKSAYDIAIKQKQIVLKKEHNIQNYEIEAEINYFEIKDKDDCLIATSTVDMKAEIMSDFSQRCINDRQEYNTDKVCQKDSCFYPQKYCLLMIFLCEVHKSNLKKIFCIDNIDFDIKVIYKCKAN